MKKMLILGLLISGFAFTACQSNTTKTEKSHDSESTTEPAQQDATLVSNANANYVVDAAASTLNWKGTKPTGEHIGTVNISEGSFSIDNGQVQSGQVTFDMSSVVTTDLEGEWKTKLENHLQSADFFDVANHPTAGFELMKGDGGNYAGKLTLLGVAKEVTVPAEVVEKDGKMEVVIKPFTIDRTDWGIKYKSKKFFKDLTDKLIHDDMEISGTVVLVAK